MFDWSENLNSSSGLEKLSKYCSPAPYLCCINPYAQGQEIRTLQSPLRDVVTRPHACRRQASAAGQGRCKRQARIVGRGRARYREAPYDKTSGVHLPCYRGGDQQHRSNDHYKKKTYFKKEDDEEENHDSKFICFACGAGHIARYCEKAIYRVVSVCVLSCPDVKKMYQRTMK